MQSWNEFLATLGHRDQDFGDVTGELAAAAKATVMVPLSDLGLLRASGIDAAEYLHNLLSNDVKNIQVDTVRLAGFCTAKGRLLATPVIWRDGNDFLLLLSADLLPATFKKLAMFVLRSKVKLSDASAERVLLGIAGPSAAAALAELGVAAPGSMQAVVFASGQVIGVGESRFLLSLAPEQAIAVWKKLSAQARPAGLSAWHWLEIAAGIPRIVAATQEAFVPQMVNFELVGGVSFTKGCYPGQEIVARTHYLGKIKRRMYRAKLDLEAAAGTSLYSSEAADQSCGELVQVAPSPNGGYECLAVIQTPSAGTGHIRVGSVDGPALSLLTLPYALPN